MKAMTRTESDTLEFHLVVNSMQGHPEIGFVAAVAHAPVDRWGTRFNRLPDLGTLQQQLALDGVVIPRDASGNLSAQWRLEEGTSTRLQIATEPAGQPRNLLRFRHALFAALFPQETDSYHLLVSSCLRARTEQRPLRLKLELAPELTNLPWELMRCPPNHSSRQWVEQTRISILRYLGEIEFPATTQASGPATVLLVRADPAVTRTPVLTESFLNEWNKVREILRRQEGRVSCETIEGEDTFSQLVDRVHSLTQAGRRIIGLHFIGHGGVDDAGGFLLGEGKKREGRRIYELDLREALDSADALRWVFLNACSTGYTPIGCPLGGLATSLSVVKNVPTVIAYTRPVATSDAEAFAPEFYKMVLDDGIEIEAAIRHLMHRGDDSGGLVVLARTIAGRMQTALHLAAVREHLAPTEPVSAPQPPAAPPLAAAPVAAAAAQAVGSLRARSAMLSVPAGAFRRGLTDPQIDRLIEQFKQSELPLEMASAAAVLRQERTEEVVLDAFEIDETPVTNVEFRRFVEATGYVTEAERLRSSPRTWRTKGHLDDHPVVCVSYDDAHAFSEWASKRLPTADEWKKACRGPNGWIYPWGEDFDVNRCNTAESQDGWETTPVRHFPAGRSPYGCFDMVGNVEEWTSTVADGDYKIILGGSWCMTCQVYGLPVLHRLASRTFYSNELGFRCARTPMLT